MYANVMHDLEAVSKDRTRLSRVLHAMSKWLEANEPEVFQRGLWDAIQEAQEDPPEDPGIVADEDTDRAKGRFRACL